MVLSEKFVSDIETLIKNTVALTKAVAYKKNVGAKTNSLIENGIEEFNVTAYQAMKDENPKAVQRTEKIPQR